MSDDRIFERNAQAWLEVGPSTAPKRVVDAALLAIETTPQQRDLRAPWRLPRLTIQTRFAVAAAVGLLVVGAGVLILRTPQNQIGTPSPSPTASPRSGPILLGELKGTWASVGTRSSPAQIGSRPLAISFDSTKLRIGQPKIDIDSTWSLVDAGTRLSLEFSTSFEAFSANDPSRWDCQVGDEGAYDIELSDDGGNLTLVPVSDACAPRAAMLDGSWTRWFCVDTYTCSEVTRQEPGRYIAPIFKPLGDGTSGQFAYTLPDGWATVSAPPTWPATEWPERIFLRRWGTSAGIDLFSHAAMGAPSCVPNGPVRNGPADAAAWMATLPGLIVTPPEVVSIGGLSGVMVDLSLEPDWTNRCDVSQDDNGAPVYDGRRFIFTNSEGSFDGLNVNVDERARYILLDRGDGDVLLIRIQAQGKEAWDQLVAQAMPVVESFEFIPDAVAPSLSPTVSSLQDLGGTWASLGPRPFPHGDSTPMEQVMTIDQSGLRINAFKGDVTSALSIDADTGDIVLRLTQITDVLLATSWDCQSEDVGAYTAVLAAGGQTLSLTPKSDSCSVRLGILSGAWTRWSCPPSYDYAYCQHFTDLARGRYLLPLFRPFGASTTGQLSYAVNTGWAKVSRPPSWPALGSSSEAWLTRMDDAPDGHAIDIYSNLRPSNANAVLDTPYPACEAGVQAPSRSAEGIADFLATLPYLSVSARTPVTIGGLGGVQIDVSLVQGFIDPCSWGVSEGVTTYDKAIAIFASPDQSAGIWLDPDGNQVARFIFLDSGEDHELISISAPDRATLDARIAVGMPVIETFQFIQ